MAIKDGPVAAGFQGAGLAWLKTLPYLLRREAPKKIELLRAQCIEGM